MLKVLMEKILNMQEQIGNGSSKIECSGNATNQKHCD